MSRWTEVDVRAGSDVFSFDTGNRSLAEDLCIPLHGEKVFQGAQAIAFLNRDVSWHDHCPEYYRELVMRITHREREQFSQEILNLMTSTYSFDVKAEQYDKMCLEWPLSVRIFYAG